MLIIHQIIAVNINNSILELYSYCKEARDKYINAESYISQIKQLEAKLVRLDYLMETL